ncbi:hypothetical protein K5X82_02290 [Halosquirtibacter xylanolyticus]|uniref:hypothetical protein n=1 Tax=Halosquirtibacter xylanolyticus TaxID=3374599 RepID=UPI00374A345E|nr:hypothetical protein K5X82_02290 [Prolixibacteraceae bacterium]
MKVEEICKWLCIIALVSGNCYAQKNIIAEKFTLSVDGRIEYDNVPAGTVENDIRSSSFSSQGLILYSDIKLTNNLSIFYRQEFAGYLAREGQMNTHINMLLLKYRLNRWKFTLGRQPLINGTYEGYYLPGDVYAYSELSCGFPVWKTGTCISRMFGKQEFGIQVLNGDLTPKEAKQQSTPLMFNVYWCGNIGNGLILSRLNFAGYASDHFSRFSSKIGLHWTLSHILLDTDFGVDHGLPGFAPDKVKVIAAPIQCIWRYGLIRPGFKYLPNLIENNTESKFRFVDPGKTSYKQQLLLFLDIYPWKNKNFHLFTIGGCTEYGVYQNHTFTASHRLYDVRVGVKFGLDLL